MKLVLDLFTTAELLVSLIFNYIVVVDKHTAILLLFSSRSSSVSYCNVARTNQNRALNPK